MIGSLASCCAWFRGDDKETRMSRDEKIKTKQAINALIRLENAAQEAFPIALLGFAGWTLIWLYRGFKYPSMRGKQPLHTYVDKTYLYAKTFGVATFLAGMFYVLREHPPPTDGTDQKGNTEVKKEVKKEVKQDKTEKTEVKAKENPK